MDWDSLQHFLAIARNGTLSAAARALQVTQSTMSRRLDALELRMGVRLLNKTPHGYALTPIGEAILAGVERMEAEALRVERTIIGKDMSLEGTVRITSVETLATEVLAPLLATLHQHYPGIVIDLVADLRTLSLTKREADISIRMIRPTQPDLIARRVGSIGFGIYASPDYLRRRGKPDFSGGAEGHQILVTSPDVPGMEGSSEWFAGLTHRGVRTFQANSRAILRAATEAGLGIACLARYLGDASPSLVRLEVPPPPFSRELWMAVHEDTRAMPRIRVVTEFLAREMKSRLS
jgi:DNA-binding transcriptional LysR family regulator